MSEPRSRTKLLWCIRSTNGCSDCSLLCHDLRASRSGIGNKSLLPSIGYNIIFASVLLLYSDSSYFDKGRNRWLLVVYFIFPISAVCVAMLSAVFYLSRRSHGMYPHFFMRHFLRGVLITSMRGVTSV